ncbi:MAG: hypothetical protein Q7T16_00710 [Candidatus Burarchaeum sp.]|nr:hypothetical protein [Candidatus Burarchaeum sp.]MDO8339157.1 hypothetical protein [Candidatus Burarchaeum sp.]
MHLFSVGRTAAVALLLAMLFLAGAVELYAPGRARLGEQVEAVALVNGVQAAGEIGVVSPSGTEEKYAGGYARFEVDEAGVWKVEYEGEVREIIVETPLTLPAYAEPLAYGLFALALLVIAYAWLGARRKLFVEKRFRNGTVEIEVRNQGEELAGVQVADFVPEDAVLEFPRGAAHGARESRDARGRGVRWTIPVLRAGGRIVLEYGIKTSAKSLPHAEVRATLAREIIARSDSVGI